MTGIVQKQWNRFTNLLLLFLRTCLALSLKQNQLQWWKVSWWAWIRLQEQHNDNGDSISCGRRERWHQRGDRIFLSLAQWQNPPMWFLVILWLYRTGYRLLVNKKQGILGFNTTITCKNCHGFSECCLCFQSQGFSRCLSLSWQPVYRIHDQIPAVINIPFSSYLLFCVEDVTPNASWQFSHDVIVSHWISIQYITSPLQQDENWK